MHVCSHLITYTKLSEIKHPSFSADIFLWVVSCDKPSCYQEVLKRHFSSLTISLTLEWQLTFILMKILHESEYQNVKKCEYCALVLNGKTS